ncbi:hypothetical protein M5G20_14905 [Pseudomonas sp. TNT2022 ID1044]|uniref:hypothetical protein n=1 Tax=Pseudomonas sp. TNT2022 ID1044 TaxID=2942636 RepID=UPI002360B60C|nr:hypothetical protein [Pseudomonas sp. TNT2022 ID1044]MDD0997145.1 hypothetical protein [Pseudomonas sp. TNT2022 ID1044]
MSDLLNKVLDAHGGLERWKRFNTVKATIVSGGELWGIKGVVQDAMPREMTVSLQQQRASVTPFGNPDWRTAFRADYIAIETTQGEIVRERLNPREAFVGHDLDTPWDPLHRAYFSGYAMWTYLTTPFFMVMSGFKVTEIAPWQEGSEAWRGLRVEFADDIASHCRLQDLYFGDNGLLRRHDYHVDIAGGFAAAQYVSDYVEAQGLRFPTRRRAYLRDEKLQPLRERLMVSIDLSDFRLS